MSDKLNKSSRLLRMKLLILEPRFAIKMIWIGILTRFINRKQANIQKWLNYFSKLAGNIKATPTSKSVTEITEANMFMCITINSKDMMELHGVIANGELELKKDVQDIGTRSRILYVGNVADIKRAIIFDYEIREQEKFIRRKQESSKWN